MTGDHDGKCEAEWESGAMAYTPCGCSHRRATGWEAVKSHVDSIAPPVRVARLDDRGDPASVHDVPVHYGTATRSTGRAHVLDVDCWCRPAASIHGGQSVVEHRSRPPKELIVRTPRKRPRWMRPWGNR